MQKIIPHLWFAKEAEEAANFYASVFPRSSVTHVQTLSSTPGGDTPVVSFTVMDKEFMAISAGPLFKLNPSISFIVNFDPKYQSDAAQVIDEVWKKLTEGGKILMPYDKYPFAEKFGWVEDKFCVSWQLMLTDPTGEDRPGIIPAMMFIKHNSGKAKEAIDFYLSIFKDSTMGQLVTYPAGNPMGKEGEVMFADFKLLDTWMSAMDSGDVHDFNFNEAVSIMINCKDQAEIDYYWEKLSAVPEAEQCGWVKDKYGVSWQIVPEDMDRMMREGTPEQMQRVTQAFLKMKKFDLAELEKAYKGE